MTNVHTRATTQHARRWCGIGGDTTSTRPHSLLIGIGCAIGVGDDGCAERAATCATATGDRRRCILAAGFSVSCVLSARVGRLLSLGEEAKVVARGEVRARHADTTDRRWHITVLEFVRRVCVPRPEWSATHAACSTSSVEVGGVVVESQQRLMEGLEGLQLRDRTTTSTQRGITTAAATTDRVDVVGWRGCTEQRLRVLIHDELVCRRIIHHHGAGILTAHGEEK